MGSSQDNGEDINWDDANKFCGKYCNGWHMPTVPELMTISDPKNGVECGAFLCRVKSGIELTSPFLWPTTKKNGNDATIFIQYSGGTINGSIADGEKRRVLCIK